MSWTNCGNKYNAKKTVVDGIKFDSIRESERYGELILLKKAGLIKDLILQPRFELQGSFTHQGKTVRAITYIADFQYVDCETSAIVIEDVKGVETKEFAIKKKMFLKRYGDLYEFRIVK